MEPHGLPIAATFDHVAVAVPRIVDALSLYQDLLGGEFFTGGDNVLFGFRAAQFSYPGGKMEILEPLAGSDFLDRFFAHRPFGGPHHVTFRVPDLQDAIEATEAAGFHVHGERTEDPRWQEVFIHPKQANGLLLQLAQAGPGYGRDEWDLEDVLAGHGHGGDGSRSPGF